MIQEIGGLVLDPAGFFARINKEPADYSLPFLFAGCEALVFLVYCIFTFPKEALEYPSTLLIVVMMSLLVPLVEWIVISAVLFVCCRAFSGTGSFRATFNNAGYCILPVALIAVLNLVSLPAGLKAGGSSPVNVLSAAVFFLLLGVLVIWTASLWMHAMENAHALPHRNARAIAIAAGILYAVYNFVGWISYLMH